MSGKSGQNSKKGRPGRRRRSRNKFPEKNVPKCPLCGQSVRDVLTAICSEDGESPVHFDCVLKSLSKTESLANREKICYLGNGEFGVVRFGGGSSSSRFTIRKRIRFEPKEGAVEWRKEIASRLPVR